jgi:nucleotide-binding universal stress UspA family protein
MAGFKHLLFCVTDDDDAVVQYVARLVAATRADLTIVDVVEDIPPIARRLLPSSWNLPAFVRTQKESRIETAADVARRAGARPATALLRGSPIKALVREVVRGDHDLLAVGAASAGTVQCIKASATRLLREAPCPVLLVNPARRRRRHRPRVLVAVDTDMWNTKGKAALTAKIIKNAIWFAEKNDAELHVIHAWIPYAERTLVRAGVNDAEAHAFLAGIRAESHEHLARTLAPFRTHIKPARVHLVKGDAREVIADFATSLGIDTLVVGTVGRSGLAGRVIGNTAEAILNRMPCSMLVIKPDDLTASKRRRAARIG